MFRRGNKSEVIDKEYVMERRLDLASERPNGKASEAFTGPHIGAPEQQSLPRASATVLLVIHPNATGLVDVVQFDRPEEALRFIEDLIATGADRDAIHCFRAAKVDFNVTFRPVVGFTGL